MLLEGKVGPQTLADGVHAEARLGRTGEVIVSHGHAYLREAVLRGNCFAVANQSGVTSQAGLSATTPVLTLFNPPGSGVNLELIYAGALLIVANAAAAVVWLAANTATTAAVVTGTATTARSIGSCTSSSERCAASPCTVARVAFTATMRPVNPPARRLASTLPPTFEGLWEAPTTATARGWKKTSSAPVTRWPMPTGPAFA